MTRHKGIVHARLRAAGVAAAQLGSVAREERDHRAGRAVLALEELADELGTRVDPHLGAATLSVGRIGGGSADEHRARRRLAPARPPLPARRGRRLACAPSSRARSRSTTCRDVRVEWCTLEKASLATPADDPSVLALQAALADAGLETEPASVAFGTDAGEFSARGWPGIVFGPGSIAQAHTHDEWVAIDAGRGRAARIFERLLSTREVSLGRDTVSMSASTRSAFEEARRRRRCAPAAATSTRIHLQHVPLRAALRASTHVLAEVAQHRRRAPAALAGTRKRQSPLRRHQRRAARPAARRRVVRRDRSSRHAAARARAAPGSAARRAVELAAGARARRDSRPLRDSAR